MAKKTSYEKDFFTSASDFESTQAQQKVNYIRHWILQELAYWQDIRLLNTLHRLDMQPFENLPKREIIRQIGLALAKKHTSKEKRMVIKKACNYALEQSRDSIHAWLGE